jgi:hypothetical protein
MDPLNPANSVNDDILTRDLERALAVDPSPEFVARVRARIAEEPSPASPPFGWLFAGVAIAAVAAAVVLAVFVDSPARQTAPATAPLLASRSITSSIVVPDVGPAKAGPHEDRGLREGAGPRTPSFVGSGFSRTYTMPGEPAILIDAREMMALQRLIAGVRDARVDLTPLLKEATAAPMVLQPIDGLVIPPITIEPLVPGGVEGERP